jgi:hypothetical protein
MTFINRYTRVNEYVNANGKIDLDNLYYLEIDPYDLFKDDLPLYNY